MTELREVTWPQLGRRVSRPISLAWFAFQALACGYFLLSTACSRANVERHEKPLSVSIGMALPARSLDVGPTQVAKLLANETLVTLGVDGRVLPRLAERWERSEDGRTWRFFLKPGVRFHDGSLLTAALVRDRIRETVRQGSGFGPSFGDVTSVEAEGGNVVVIELRRASSLLVADLVEVDIVRDEKPRRLSTGAFYQDSFSNDVIVMRRFTGYHGGTPAIERLELRTFETVRKAWTAMMRGEVDFLYEVGPDAADFVENESSVQTFSFLRAYSLALGFNMRHPILRSRAVRQALNRAVDRDAIVADAFRGRGRPASGPIWPQHWAFSAAVPTYTFNREAAELGFTAAGYETIDASEGRMPSRFRFRCLVYPALERVALIIQKQLYEVGVDMMIEQAQPTEALQRIARGDYDAYIVWLVNARSLTWPYLFWHSPEARRPALIESGYSAADTALDRVRYAQNDDEFRNAVAALQQVLYDDPPAIFLAWEERLRAVSRNFRVPNEPGRDIVAGLWRWTPAADLSGRAQ